ncbi:4-oxalocrotonate tautomerase [Methanosarcina horonobensis HB-1 = JCM 15518]|uniref:4-oxalocrotonate tautomerase n=1 Tax=Methanosarcina horonobensis HB-1 = JCM 15518 TaxID=1434110 RepID=A0A0E3SB66_9EURY|nr:4-oxalocrotonate tautomerase family protein [Methanosarcina horonobensis]AKB79034.1 4-oxalocrotonate tautomerase [Methanosarcina horonobensis HB-1 = JCM 15518]
MPYVDIKLIEGVFSEDEIKKLIKDVTDVVVSFMGENLRSYTVVTVQEVKSGSWGVGGQAIGLEEVRAMQAGSTKKAEEF